MRQYDLDRPAQLDILDLFDSARDYSEAFERRFADGLVECFERLAEYPYSGRERVDLMPELRSVVIRNLSVIVFYFPLSEGQDRVRIARVLRQERDVGADDFGSA